jgi:septum formation protein
MKIILASESPFRRRALDMLKLAYATLPASIDEKAIRHDEPVELTRMLAESKARTVASRCGSAAVIVAGDAVACKDRRIYEKPRDHSEAAQFLRELSGSEFQFVTALAVLRSDTGKMLSAVETLNITFRPLLESEIQGYINEYPVLNYAGAFEDDAVHMFAEHLSGSYNIGTALPVSRLTLFLREQGVAV